MTASIPASEIVNVIPNVIGTGGNGLDVIGLFLTQSTRVPIGSVLSFGSQPAVASFFGPSSPEASAATRYFGSFNGATASPGAILFSQYAATDVAAWIRSGSLASLSLTQLQTLSGVLTLTIDGSPVTSGTINFATATSFSNAATMIQTGIGTTGVTCAFDPVLSAFVITGADVGVDGSMSFATGTLADPLKFTAATGAVLSQGAVADTPASAMDDVVAESQDWVTFTTMFKPPIDDMVAFANWTNTAGNGGRGNRFAYVMWDNDAAPTTDTDTTSAGALIRAAGYSGTVPIYDPSDGLSIAAAAMGWGASIDFGATNGRTTFAFRSQDGLTAGVTNQVIAENLIANGYNFYGSYATANQPFVFFYPGSITGKFLWFDSYVDQVWLNNGFQLALMSLLTGLKSIPYNAAGYGLIEAAMSDPIAAALNFGAIRAGVTLSALQAAEVNTAAGLKVDDVISQRGWYIQVLDPGAQVRGQRGSPIVNFWYTDGQSIQRIVLNSVEIA